jgi:hypothetical protein
VVFHPVNGTVWLSKCELIGLFGVYTQTINACIAAILKTEVFDPKEICKCHLIAQTGKNKIRYEPYEFNLVFIVAMAFRMDSENAEILRKWIIKQILMRNVPLSVPIMNIQDYEWN